MRECPFQFYGVTPEHGDLVFLFGSEARHSTGELLKSNGLFLVSYDNEHACWTLRPIDFGVARGLGHGDEIRAAMEQAQRWRSADPGVR